MKKQKIRPPRLEHQATVQYLSMTGCRSGYFRLLVALAGSAFENARREPYLDTQADICMGQALHWHGEVRRSSETARSNGGGFFRLSDLPGRQAVRDFWGAHHRGDIRWRVVPKMDHRSLDSLHPMFGGRGGTLSSRRLLLPFETQTNIVK